jgi:hypothetical protein
MAVHAASPSATIAPSAQLLLHPHSEQIPSSRIRPIAPRPPITTITPTPHSLPAPICQSLGPVFANLSIIHPISVQPTLPPYASSHCVPGPSNVEPSEDELHGRRTHRYFPEPAPSTLSAVRPSPLNRVPQSRVSTIESQNHSHHIVDQALQLLRDDLE